MIHVSRDAVRRALRTFIYAFLGIAIPGGLGWLNDLTAWASADGQKPFPDWHNLSFLLVSAVAAGVIAVVNLVGNTIEDASGRAVLRDVPKK